MKRAISILILFAFMSGAVAQQESEPILIKPVAFDRFFWLSSPANPRQVFVAEVQNSSKSLVKVIYFPKTDGYRGGATEFIDPKTLSNNTVWKLKLHRASGDEKLYCKTDNYIRTSKNKIDTNESGEQTLRFHSTQIDADIKFNNLSEMGCMIVDSFSK
jgi:hypothetical protein